MKQSREIKSAVITGPTGMIGAALCKELLNDKVTVFAVCNPESRRKNVLPQGVKIVECGLNELRKLPKIIQGKADAFFHLAWAKTTGAGRNDLPTQIDNIRYTVDAVRAAGQLGCSVFIGAGSQAECGRVSGLIQPQTPCFPENGYGMAKLCAGEMSRLECKKFGIAHIWGRILSVYGPGDGLSTMISSVILKLLSREVPALTAGEQLWDYLYVEDAARAFRLLSERGEDGKIYPIGSGRARKLREFISILRDAIDPGLPLGFGEIPYGANQVMHLQADISSLQEDTGFVPQVDFEAGIRSTIESIKGSE
jgi:UDP-glucose 4-epimerase